MEALGSSPGFIPGSSILSMCALSGNSDDLMSWVYSIHVGEPGFLAPMWHLENQSEDGSCVCLSVCLSNQLNILRKKQTYSLWIMSPLGASMVA